VFESINAAPEEKVRKELLGLPENAVGQSEQGFPSVVEKTAE
jgi:hypothetical protein